jgi:FtsZ-binding cell division protein ZapB
MKKTTDPFRVTIILGDESPVAQIEQIERIIDDGGEIIASKILPAETLAMPISEEIIGALNASLLAQVEPLTKERDDLTAQVETLTSERDGLTTERDGLTGQVESLTTERDTVKTERDTVTSERDAVTSERDGLLSQVESLTAQIESMTKAQEVIDLEPIAPQPIPAYGVSKLSIMRRLGDKWPTLKAALATLPETVQDSWTLALGISADDPLFIEFRPQLIEILEMTEEEFDALLAL